MNKFKLKTDIKTGEEFAHYRANILVGMSRANVDPMTKMKINKLCRSIDELFSLVSQKLVLERRHPNPIKYKDEIRELRKKISESLEILNEIYFLEILMGDFNK